MMTNSDSPRTIAASLIYHAEFKRMDAEFKRIHQSMGRARARA